MPDQTKPNLLPKLDQDRGDALEPFIQARMDADRQTASSGSGNVLKHALATGGSVLLLAGLAHGANRMLNNDGGVPAFGTPTEQLDSGPHPAGLEIASFGPNGARVTEYKSWDQLTAAQKEAAVLPKP